MKQALIILSLALFSYVQFFNGMVLLKYELNKTEIIQKFCENKDKPKMQCDGKCHLKKMMLDEGDTQGEEPITTLPDIQLFIEDFGFELLNTEVFSSHSFGYSNLYSYGLLNEIDIPPRA